MKPIITKLGWAGFIVAGASFVYFIAPGKGEWIHAGAVVAVGLAMFFLARTPAHDGRVEQLKLKGARSGT